MRATEAFDSSLDSGKDVLSEEPFVGVGVLDGRPAGQTRLIIPQSLERELGCLPATALRLAFNDFVFQKHNLDRSANVQTQHMRWPED